MVVLLFYYMFDRRKWLLKAVLIFTLLLVASISIKRFKALRATNVTFLNLGKHQGIVFKQGDKAVILTDLLPTDKNYQYAVQPYLDSCKISDTLVRSFKQNISSAFMIKTGNLIQFQNKKILIIDKSMQGKQLPEKLKTDYLYLTGNPRMAVNQLNSNYTYARLVIDGSNTNRRISNLKHAADSLHLNYVVLKRNNSLVVPSN